MSEPDHTAVAVIPREQLPEKLHPVVAAAMQRELDPQTLRDLLAVQREWEAGEAKRAFTAALVGLKRDLPTVIARDKVVDFTSAKGRTRYTHTSLAAVMDAVTEPLTAHGFSLSWEPSTKDGKVFVTCRLTHSAGHSIETTLDSGPDTGGNKSPAQAIASAITLLERYSALALLGIATADMKEPEGEPDPEHIDTARNMRACKAMSDAGYTKEEAETLIGRTVDKWTADDLAKLRGILKEINQSKTKGT